MTASVQIATCIGCACTDERACKAGCHWERVDYSAQLGVCSECPEFIAKWDAGERKFAPIANRRIASRNYYRENASAWRDKYNVNRKTRRATRP